jgi:hypothetical protein
MTSYLPWQEMTVAANYATVELFVNERGWRYRHRGALAAIHPADPVTPVLEARAWIGDMATIFESGTSVARKHD